MPSPDRFPRYERLLKLYPKPYRDRYADQMLQTLSDMLEDQPPGFSKVLVWWRVGRDLPLSIMHQNALAIGDNLMHETPRYVKRNGAVAGALLVPFFAALIANGLDKVINNQTLQGSWLWKMPALAVWVLYLPLVAFLLAGASYVRSVARHQKKPWLKRIFDVKHAWPIMLPAVLALGVLFVLAFHDSAQCVQHLPSYLVGHTREVWQCAAHNESLPVFRKLF